MDTFFISHDEFWTWFDRDPSTDKELMSETDRLGTKGLRNKFSRSTDSNSNVNNTGGKRMRTNEGRARHISETEASIRCDGRYIIMHGRHRPGKKNKVWEGDGYLTLINQIAHLSDLKGKMLEEPIVLDEIDLQAVKDLSELRIGDTEVQVVEPDSQ